MAEEVVLSKILQTYYMPSETDPDVIYEIHRGIGTYQGIKAIYWTCSCLHFKRKLKYYAGKCKHINNFSEEDSNDKGKTKRSNREVGKLTKLGKKNPSGK